MEHRERKVKWNKDKYDNVGYSVNRGSSRLPSYSSYDKEQIEAFTVMSNIADKIAFKLESILPTNFKAEIDFWNNWVYTEYNKQRRYFKNNI
ncbi:MAG TPA: hypothetical protein PK507_03105 [bacterium]|nr:hypothetical protein [bacterium]